MLANKTYVSPASEEIGLLYEGVILAESNVNLGFEFEEETYRLLYIQVCKGCPRL